MNSVLRITIFFLLILFVAICQAEERPLQPHARQPVKDRPDLPGYLKETTEQGITLPSAPIKKEADRTESTVELKKVVFEGNSIFSDEALHDIARPFFGRLISLSELETLRYKLTRLYVDAGYINSGVLLKPDQDVSDGRVTYLIIEGCLNQINITGNGRLNPGYVSDRLWPDYNQPFNTTILQEHFQLLLQDSLIDGMHGRIHPGVEPGEAILDVDITRARPYDLSIILDNHNPPSNGSERIMLAGTVRNLTGYGDAFNAAVGIREGADEIATEYSVFLNSRDTQLTFSYTWNENAVIEAHLESIDIESESQNAELMLTHPIHRTLKQDVNLGVTLSVEQSKTFLLNRPFSFSAGAVDGKSQVTALRLIQSFLNRTPNSALAIRSSFNFGIDLFGPTVHRDNRPDGKFFFWLGQVQFAKRIGDKYGQYIFRGDVQISEDKLLPLEQFAIGGANTVRGYRENEQVRDNGFVLSLEWRYPLWHAQSSGERENLVEIAPFIDYGSSWNKGSHANKDYLLSAGVGLLWRMNQRISAEIYFAHNIEKARSYEEYDLQDDGIHFRLSASLF